MNKIKRHRLFSHDSHTHKHNTYIQKNEIDMYIQCCQNYGNHGKPVPSKAQRVYNIVHQITTPDIYTLRKKNVTLRSPLTEPFFVYCRQ